MAYQIQLEQFQGPLDVLLQLIEQDELAITDIALVEIAEAFVQHLDQVEQLYPEELADFLVVATRLLYLKSRALLPLLVDEVEESAGQLAEHLKMYKEFRDAAAVLEQRLAQGQFAFDRAVSASRFSVIEFSPSSGITAATLGTVYANVMQRLDTVIQIPQAAIRKAVTLKDKIIALTKLLQQHSRLQFSDLVQAQPTKTDIVLTFLAILELVKQDAIVAQQPQHYSDILIVCK